MAEIYTLKPINLEYFEMQHYVSDTESFLRHTASEEKDELKTLYSTLHFLHLLRTGIKEECADKHRQTLPQSPQNVLSDINKNRTEIHSLTYLTEKYYISQSTLQRLFKKYLHTTPKAYIETKRLAYSRVLLKQGFSVFDACMQAGFPDYSNYVQLFKRKLGLPRNAIATNNF